MKISEVLIILVILFLVYWLSSIDDDPIQPDISIKYKCELVMRQHDPNKQIIEFCKHILKENDDE